MTNLLSRLLDERPWLLADGATGTNLIAMGLSQGYPPEFWNVEQESLVRAHYRSFIESGSDLVLTNTFGGTANRLKLHKAAHRVHEINERAAALLADEIAKSGRTVVNAGSVGPTGDLFRPLGELTREEGRKAYAEQMRGLKAGGADVAWIETMFSEEELRAALEAASEVGLPAVITMSFDTSGRTMMGQTPAEWVELARTLGPSLIAFGGNCGTGAPDLLAGLLSVSGLLQEREVFVVKANCGLPELRDGEVHYSGTPELMAEYARMARDAGARIIGGCCGTTPAHVKAMHEALLEEPRRATPTLQDIATRIGPLTGSTRSLVEGGGPKRRQKKPSSSQATG